MMENEKTASVKGYQPTQEDLNRIRTTLRLYRAKLMTPLCNNLTFENNQMQYSGTEKVILETEDDYNFVDDVFQILIGVAINTELQIVNNKK